MPLTLFLSLSSLNEVIVKITAGPVKYIQPAICGEFCMLRACDWSPIIIAGTVSKNATDTQCSQMIASVVKKKDVQEVLLMGDSSMRRLWREARAYQKGELFSSKLITTSRCDWLQSFGIEPSKVWRKPNPRKEGPIQYGLKNHWCTDCSGCNSYVVFPQGQRMEGNVPGSNFLSINYIAVEFARDVEMQSILGNTTQQTLSRYLLSKHKTYSLCFLYMGIHDQAIRGFRAKDYVLNVKELLELFFPVCIHIIWIEITAPRGHKIHPQTIAKTGEWNSALKLYLDTHCHLNVSMMRVFKKSLHARHVDNVHMHVSWYTEMARTMLEEM